MRCKLTLKIQVTSQSSFHIFQLYNRSDFIIIALLPVAHLSTATTFHLNHLPVTSHSRLFFFFRFFVRPFFFSFRSNSSFLVLFVRLLFSPAGLRPFRHYDDVKQSTSVRVEPLLFQKKKI